MSTELDQVIGKYLYAVELDCEEPDLEWMLDEKERAELLARFASGELTQYQVTKCKICESCNCASQEVDSTSGIFAVNAEEALSIYLNDGGEHYEK